MTSIMDTVGAHMGTAQVRMYTDTAEDRRLQMDMAADRVEGWVADRGEDKAGDRVAAGTGVV